MWYDKEEGRKRRLVVNISKMSQNWDKGTVRMESLAEFASVMQRGDHLESMDI